MALDESDFTALRRRALRAVVATPVFIAAVSVIAYLIVWVYQVGYYSEFHIPLELIVPTLQGIFVVAVAVGSVFLTSAPVAVLRLFELHDLTEKEFIYIRGRLYFIAVATVVSAFLHLLSFWGVSLMNTVLLYFLIWLPIRRIRKNKTEFVTEVRKFTYFNLAQMLQIMLDKRGFINSYVALYFLLFVFFLGQDRWGQQCYVSSGRQQQYALIGILGDQLAMAPLERHETGSELSTSRYIIISPGLKFLRIGDPSTPGFIWTAARMEPSTFEPEPKVWWQDPIWVLRYHPGLLRALPQPG